MTNWAKMRSEAVELDLDPRGSQFLQAVAIRVQYLKAQQAHAKAVRRARLLSVVTLGWLRPAL